MAYEITNGYDPLRTISHEGQTFSYQMRIPAGANVNTPLAVNFWLAQAGRRVSDYGGNAANCIAAQRNDDFGLRTDAGQVNGFSIFAPLTDATDANRTAFYTLHPQIIAAEQARGFNFNTLQINGISYSTGSIITKHLWYRVLSFWSAFAGIDGSCSSSNMTDNGSDGPAATLGSEFLQAGYTPGASTPPAQPQDDTVMFADMARQLLTTEISWCEFTSSRPEFDPHWSRRLNDYTPLISALNALSPGIARTSTNTLSSQSLDLLPTDRFLLRTMTDKVHDTINFVPFSATHWVNSRSAPPSVGAHGRGRRLSGMLL
jgi:hypothetical protein